MLGGSGWLLGGFKGIARLFFGCCEWFLECFGRSLGVFYCILGNILGHCLVVSMVFWVVPGHW